VISWPGKLRVLCEPLIPARRSDDEESVHDFASRRIGREAAAVLVDAMVSGIYAGDTRRLSLQAAFPKMRRMESEHGSLIRASLAKRRQARADGAKAGLETAPAGVLTSFPDGLQELPDKLAGALGSRLRLNAAVDRLTHLGNRGFRVHLREGAPIDADAVVVACPAWHAAPILRALDDELAGALDGIPAAPVAVVHLGYRRDALGPKPQGFGFLAPRGQGPRILGTICASNIFPTRAPDGSLLLTTMIGGAHDPQAWELDDAALERIVTADLRTTLRIEAPPYFKRIIRWPRGIAQYELGHLERRATVERRLEAFSGLWVAGQSLRGVSVNACVEEAAGVAGSASNFLGMRGQVLA
jgi:oxygen-dependent protoporphyrinogen oxidase